ncbi:hypothetical protein MLD38_026200 [Melastoma candidum]|uniref:Uncharacterized protein n=1 Tax=Melastoma candidum TaxID=119954 RepID=A0ACB9NZE4_9MYRT|nr:hypothetical protein MLD38_026200 [Melastoma candidum]
MSSPTSPPATAPAQAPAPLSDPPPNPPQGNGPAENGVSDFEDKKPHLAQADQSEDWDNFGDMDKYRKYEADYARRLMNKYFCNQNLYGGDIFEESVTIDGEVIQSSRWPCMRSYADPVNSFHEMLVNSLSSIPETNSNIANGKHSSKKSG